MEQATKDIYLKLAVVVAPADHTDENDKEKKVRKPTIMAQGFEADMNGEAKEVPAFAKGNRKILPGDIKAGAFGAYLSAIKWVTDDGKKSCVGTFLYLQTDNEFLHECQTTLGKLPYIKNKSAYAYRYFAEQLIKESGLTVSGKLVLPQKEITEV